MEIPYTYHSIFDIIGDYLSKLSHFRLSQTFQSINNIFYLLFPLR
nr:MAG TPA: hypothetical protein [Caudoviricetes sp.]